MNVAKSHFIVSFRYVAALTALLFVAGCAPLQLASEADDRVAKQFNPPADKSHIYVIRRYDFRGNAIRMSVSLDREVVGAIQNKTYLLLVVEPGKHVMEVGSSPGTEKTNVSFIRPVKIELETLPGRNYFLAANLTMSEPDTKILTEAAGKRELSDNDFRRSDRFP